VLVSSLLPCTVRLLEIVRKTKQENEKGLGKNKEN
jgi:hypothetical protein